MTNYRYPHIDGDLTIDEVARRIIRDPEWEDHREHIRPLAARILELLTKGGIVRQFTAPAKHTMDELKEAGAVFAEPSSWGLGPGPSSKGKA